MTIDLTPFEEGFLLGVIGKEVFGRPSFDRDRIIYEKIYQKLKDAVIADQYGITADPEDN